MNRIPCIGGPLNGEEVVCDERSFTMPLPDGWVQLDQSKPAICKYILVRKVVNGHSTLQYRSVRSDDELTSGQILESSTVEVT